MPTNSRFRRQPELKTFSRFSFSFFFFLFLHSFSCIRRWRKKEVAQFCLFLSFFSSLSLSLSLSFSASSCSSLNPLNSREREKERKERITARKHVFGRFLQKGWVICYAVAQTCATTAHPNCIQIIASWKGGVSVMYIPSWRVLTFIRVIHAPPSSRDNCLRRLCSCILQDTPLRSKCRGVYKSCCIVPDVTSTLLYSIIVSLMQPWHF